MKEAKADSFVAESCTRCYLATVCDELCFFIFFFLRFRIVLAVDRNCAVMLQQAEYLHPSWMKPLDSRVPNGHER